MHFQLFFILDLLGASPTFIARRAMNGSAQHSIYGSAFIFTDLYGASRP